MTIQNSQLPNAQRPSVRRANILIHPSILLWIDRLTLLVLAIGVALRIGCWLYQKSMWCDEVWQLNQIAPRTFAGLLDPHIGDQISPYAFAAISWTIIKLFGVSELVIRFMPMLAGVIGLIFSWLFFRSFLDKIGALLALWIVAFSTGVIYYAGEFKQYSLEALVTVALLLAADRAWRRRTAGNWIGLGIIGFFALFASLPAAFVLGGICLAAVVAGWRSPDRRRVIGAASILGAVWAAGFATEWMLFLRNLAGSKFLADYWGSGFVPLPPKSLSDLLWLPTTINEDFRSLFGIDNRLVRAAALGLAAMGVLSLIWPVRPFSLHRRCLVGFPLVLCLAGAAVHEYPFVGRLLQFSVVLWAFLIADGAQWLARRGGAMGFWCAACATCVALSTTVQRLPTAYVPRFIVDVRSAMQFVAKSKQPSDLVCIHPDMSTSVTFDFYQERLGWTDPSAVRRLQFDDEQSLRQEMASIGPFDRLWIILSFPQMIPGGDAKPTCQTLESTGWTLTSTKTFADVSVLCFDRSANPSSASPRTKIGGQPDAKGK